MVKGVFKKQPPGAEEAVLLKDATDKKTSIVFIPLRLFV